MTVPDSSWENAPSMARPPRRRSPERRHGSFCNQGATASLVSWFSEGLDRASLISRGVVVPWCKRGWFEPRATWGSRLV